MEEISLKELRKGDVLQVNEGDAIPTDGSLVSGIAYVDESMLTGETEMVKKEVGDSLTGASILSSGNLRMKVTAVGKETVLNKIIDLVKNAQSQEPDIQRLADRISAVFVPVVLSISVLTVLISYFIFSIPFTTALMNAIAVLVISCPCAMGLATPAAIMVGVGRAAKEGILIKGSRTLEIFAEVKNMVFDKTGTLTEGKFSISHIEYYGKEQDRINSVVHALENHSSHPIAKSLVRGIDAKTNVNFKEVKETKGLKIEGIDDVGDHWEIGSYAIAEKLTNNDKHNVYLLKNGVLAAGIDLEDALKKDIGKVIQYFNEEEITSYLLSGDKEAKVSEVANELSISNYEAEKLPEEKHARIESLKASAITVMVGDGINDAAALAKADVGITFSSASDVAVQSAGIVLLNDSAKTLMEAHKISKHTLITIKQNLFWAFAYNIVAIPIAALGFLNPMWGALFMAFSDVVVIGNSLRLRRKKLK